MACAFFPGEAVHQEKLKQYDADTKIAYTGSKLEEGIEKYEIKDRLIGGFRG